LPLLDFSEIDFTISALPLVLIVSFCRGYSVTLCTIECGSRPTREVHAYVTLAAGVTLTMIQWPSYVKLHTKDEVFTIRLSKASTRTGQTDTHRRNQTHYHADFVDDNESIYSKYCIYKQKMRFMKRFMAPALNGLLWPNACCIKPHNPNKSLPCTAWLYCKYKRNRELWMYDVANSPVGFPIWPPLCLILYVSLYPYSRYLMRKFCGLDLGRFKIIQGQRS